MNRKYFDVHIPSDNKIKAYVVYLPSENWLKHGSARGNLPQLYTESRGRAEVTKLNRWLDEMARFSPGSCKRYELREVEITIGQKVA